MSILDFLLGGQTPRARNGVGSSPRAESTDEDICPQCGGEGVQSETDPQGNEVEETCPLCQGSGQAEA